MLCGTLVSSCVGTLIFITCVSLVKPCQINFGKPHHIQVSRAAVEGYTGEGEPPCIVMTLRAVSDKTTPPDLSLNISLNGVEHSQPSTITLERKGELSLDGYGFDPKLKQSEATGQ